MFVCVLCIFDDTLFVSLTSTDYNDDCILSGTSYPSSISRRLQHRASIDDEEMSQRFETGRLDVDDEDVPLRSSVRQRKVSLDSSDEQVSGEPFVPAKHARKSDNRIRLINLSSSKESNRGEDTVSFDVSPLRHRLNTNEQRLFFSVPPPGSKRSKSSQHPKFRIFAIEFNDEDDLSVDQLSEETDDVSGRYAT